MKTILLTILLFLTVGGFSQEWTCGNNYTDTRDGHVYKTALINGKCWMTQNLNYGTMLPLQTPQTDNGVPEKYCLNGSEAMCSEYGGWYQWGEVTQYQETPSGICPDGWHVSKLYEWMDVIELYGGQEGDLAAGPKLKEPGYTHWNKPSSYEPYNQIFYTKLYPTWKPTNTSGMTLLGNGAVTYNGVRTNWKTVSYNWTNDKVHGNYFIPEPPDPVLRPVVVTTSHNQPTVGVMTSYEYRGFGVRCVKD